MKQEPVRTKPCCSCKKQYYLLMFFEHLLGDISVLANKKIYESASFWGEGKQSIQMG